MNELAAVSNSLNAALAAPTAAALAGARNELGQEDFLKLMITQFRNQDPTQPTDSTQFLGQLAQFSTVSGIQGLQDSFAGLAASLRGDQALRATALIGHEVLVPSPAIAFDGETAASGAVEVPVEGAAVTVQISDPSGRLLRTIDLGRLPAGLAAFQWDGRAADGSVLAPGTYVATAQATLGTATQSIATFARAGVRGVSLAPGGGTPLLRLDGFGEVPLDRIREIL